MTTMFCPLLLLIALVLIPTGVSAQQGFSCSYGDRGACLGFGETVCSSSGMCVDQNAACFDKYPIDFFHIDIAEVQTAEGRLYLFVAIDRTSKFAFVELHRKALRKAAADLSHAILSKPCLTRSTLC